MNVLLKYTKENLKFAKFLMEFWIVFPQNFYIDSQSLFQSTSDIFNLSQFKSY